MRIHVCQNRLTYEQADILQYYLQNEAAVTKVKVYERTADVSICYSGKRRELTEYIQKFRYKSAEIPTGVLQNSGRRLNAEYQEKLINKVVCYGARNLFLPLPVRAFYTGVVSMKYIAKGIQTLWRRKIEVPVLDATAIAVSVLRGDIGTAGSIICG